MAVLCICIQLHGALGFVFQCLPLTIFFLRVLGGAVQVDWYETHSNAYFPTQDYIISAVDSLRIPVVQWLILLIML